MRILHIVRHLHKLSGVSVCCAETCDALVNDRDEVEIAVKSLGDVNQIESMRGVVRLQTKDVLRGPCAYDVVHIHNLWTPDLHQAAVWARRAGVPVVWSLHGTLSPWSFRYKWWKKCLPWYLCQKRDLKSAAILHVTSEQERLWVQAAGFADKTIVNIPFGTRMRPACLRQHEVKRLLFVGRIAPVKSLEKLIMAWSKVDRTGWKLRIVGKEDFPGYTDSLRALCESLKVCDSVEFAGAKFGEDLEREYQEADILALVSETENFGAVVVDALAWGLPVITSKGTPWQGVEGEDKLKLKVEGEDESKLKVEGEEEGRGARSRSTVEFVNLEPGDTFDQIEQYLRQRVAERFENKTLGISASIGSKRNANELAKHMAAGESPEVHKFAAKNIGALFERGVVGFTHLDKKAMPDQRWIARFVRVLSLFVFGGERFIATLTLKAERAGGRLYAVEAVEINQDVKLRSTPRGAISKDLNSAPILNLTSQLTNRIAYYVGDVKRTHPAFLGRSEPFSIERAVDLIRMGGDDKSKLKVEGEGRDTRSTVEFVNLELPTAFEIVKGEEAPFRKTAEALAWARLHGLIGRMGENETGGKGVVTISAESIREALNPRQREKSVSQSVHFSALMKLRELIRASRILEVHPDWRKDSSGKRTPAAGMNHDVAICIAYAAFGIGDAVYRVRLTLKRYRQIKTSKVYAYRVNEIEVVPGTLGGKIALATSPTGTTSICANILLNGARDVNGVPLLAKKEAVEVREASGETLVEPVCQSSELSPQVDSPHPSPSTSHFDSHSRCGFWVSNDPETLAKTLREAMSLSDAERRQMGEVGREWIRRDFSWEGVGAKMKAAYEWLLDPEHVERPEWVKVV